MFSSNSHKVISALLIFVLFTFTSATAVASGLSRRRASIKTARSSSKPMRTTRNAVSQRGYRQLRSSVSGKSSSDSRLKRAFRTVVKVDARGGGFNNTVGQMMTRDNSIEARRTGNNWQRGTSYVVNAGNAVRYLANQVNRR